MIEQNIKRLFSNIEEVKYKCGITRDISVVAATKYASASDIEMLAKCPNISVGENRVQDFLVKYEENRSLDWQFIGQLQTNKVKYIVDKVSLIQSVDRINLAEKISEECIKRGICGNILIEVNIAAEASKGGVAADKLFELSRQIKELKNLNVLGLMSVMPNSAPENNRKYYLQMRELYDTLNMKIFDKKFKFLSMGMSGDYLTAIECGATMIRVGSIIFGR